MSWLVLDGALLGDALERAGDEDVIVIDHSAGELERLEQAMPDPRVFYLIGDRDVLPLPDHSVDTALGEGAGPELRRVLRARARE
jgi:hypothetical protein